jgi:hypothetical protein
VAGPLARLQELQLLTELSPQASAHVKATPEAMEELCAGLQNKLELANGRRVPHRSLVQTLSSLPDHW